MCAAGIFAARLFSIQSTVHGYFKCFVLCVDAIVYTENRTRPLPIAVGNANENVFYVNCTNSRALIG